MQSAIVPMEASLPPPMDPPGGESHATLLPSSFLPDTTTLPPHAASGEPGGNLRTAVRLLSLIHGFTRRMREHYAQRHVSSSRSPNHETWLRVRTAHCEDFNDRARLHLVKQFLPVSAKAPTRNIQGAPHIRANKVHSLSGCDEADERGDCTDLEDCRKNLTSLLNEVQKCPGGDQYSLDKAARDQSEFLSQKTALSIAPTTLSDFYKQYSSVRDLLGVTRSLARLVKQGSTESSACKSATDRRPHMVDDQPYDETYLANLEHLLLCLIEPLITWWLTGCRERVLQAHEDGQQEWQYQRKCHRIWFFEWPNARHPTSTTWPWTIKPSLAVLWGVCWMFYDRTWQHFNPQGDWVNADGSVMMEAEVMRRMPPGWIQQLQQLQRQQQMGQPQQPQQPQQMHQLSNYPQQQVPYEDTLPYGVAMSQTGNDANATNPWASHRDNGDNSDNSDIDERPSTGLQHLAQQQDIATYYSTPHLNARPTAHRQWPSDSGLTALSIPAPVSAFSSTSTSPASSSSLRPPVLGQRNRPRSRSDLTAGGRSRDNAVDATFRFGMTQPQTTTATSATSATFDPTVSCPTRFALAPADALRTSAHSPSANFLLPEERLQSYLVALRSGARPQQQTLWMPSITRQGDELQPQFGFVGVQGSPPRPHASSTPAISVTPDVSDGAHQHLHPTHQHSPRENSLYPIAVLAVDNIRYPTDALDPLTLQAPPPYPSHSNSNSDMQVPVSPVSAQSPHESVNREMGPSSPSKKRKISSVSQQDDADVLPLGHHSSSRAASIASVAAASQDDDPSPRPSRAFQRGDPPTNADNKYVCAYTEDCQGLVFDRKCEWSKHMDKHDRPYRCPHPSCAKLQGFTYSGGLLRHEREVHNKHGGPKAQLMCPHESCKRSTGKGFTRKENLNEHIRRVHQGKDLSQPSPSDSEMMHSDHPPTLFPPDLSHDLASSGADDLAQAVAGRMSEIDPEVEHDLAGLSTIAALDSSSHGVKRERPGATSNGENGSTSRGMSHHNHLVGDSAFAPSSTPHPGMVLPAEESPDVDDTHYLVRENKRLRIEAEHKDSRIRELEDRALALETMVQRLQHANA